MPGGENACSPRTAPSPRDKYPNKQSKTTAKIDELWDKLGKGSSRKEFASDQLDALESMRVSGINQRMDQLQKVKMMDDSLQNNDGLFVGSNLKFNSRAGDKTHPKL